MNRKIPNWLGHYDPWVGEAFDRQKIWPGVRLLLLGESHYFKNAKDDIAEVTCQLISNAIEGKGYRYFNRIPEILLGKHNLSMEDRSRAWNAIAFSNICQEPAEANHVPRRGAIKKSKPALYQLVLHLRPTHVVFISKRAWDNMDYDERFKKASPGEKTLRVGARNRPYEFCRATIDNAAFGMTYILHPTRGYPPPPIEESAEVVRKLLTFG